MANGLLLYPSTNKKTTNIRPESPTANQYSQVGLRGLNIAPIHCWFQIGTDTTEAGSTTEIIVATAHSAKAGDLIRFTGGTDDDIEVFVASVSTNAINLAQPLPVAPGTDGFTILRSVGVFSDASGRLIVGGGAAHDAAVTGNPLLLGMEARTTNPTAVSASGDAVRMIGDTLGRQVTLPYTIPQLIVTGATAADITDTTSTQVIAAGGAGIITYITSVEVTNTSATVTRVNVLDGATIKAFVVVGAAAGSASSMQLTFPIPLRGTANTAWNVQCITTATVTRASMTGYQAAV